MNICTNQSSSSSHTINVNPHQQTQPPLEPSPPNTVHTTSSLPLNLSVQLPDKMTDPSMATSAHDDDRDPQPLSGG